MKQEIETLLSNALKDGSLNKKEYVMIPTF
jgi:hypothetical protein